MNSETALPIFESLSSPVRLDIYRLLVKTGPDGLVAGAIADALALPASNASFHLKALAGSGLLAVEQEGRYLRYRARMGVMNQLIDFLTAECCQGQPGLCGVAPATSCCESDPT